MHVCYACLLIVYVCVYTRIHTYIHTNKHTHDSRDTYLHTYMYIVDVPTFEPPVCMHDAIRCLILVVGVLNVCFD